MVKNQIVIIQHNMVVENMMSKIQTPKDLRKRLAKHFKGTHRIYFKSNGTFFVDGEEYQWMINPKGYPKPKRPKVLYKDVLLEPRPQNDDPLISIKQVLGEYHFPYNLYPGDVIELPKLEEMQIVSQEIREGSSAKRYLVVGRVNGHISWVSINDMRYMFNDYRSLYDTVTLFAGKRFRIDKVTKHEQLEEISMRGLLTGKPIHWFVRPKYTVFPKTIEYTEL